MSQFSKKFVFIKDILQMLSANFEILCTHSMSVGRRDKKRIIVQGTIQMQRSGEEYNGMGRSGRKGNKRNAAN